MALVLLPCDLPNWPTVQRHLNHLRLTTNVDEFVEGMLKIHNLCNVGLDPDEPEKTDPTTFDGLREFLEEISPDESHRFFRVALPTMVNYALKLKVYKPIEGLHFSLQQHADHLTLERRFVASLVANSFFSSYPKRTPKTHPTLQDPNFSCFFLHQPDNKAQKAKLKSILNYFEKLNQAEPTGAITFCRQVMSGKEWFTTEDWLDCTKPLCPVVVRHEGRIEQAEPGTYQVCFVSSHIGGEVLANGRSQECLQLCTNPELLATLSCTESLEDNEAFTAHGYEQYSQIHGLKNNASFEATARTNTLNDSEGNRDTNICCIDGEDYSDFPIKQYEEDNLLRELNKAYTGFQQPKFSKRLSPVGDSFSSTLSETQSPIRQRSPFTRTAPNGSSQSSRRGSSLSGGNDEARSNKNSTKSETDSGVKDLSISDKESNKSGTKQDIKTAPVVVGTIPKQSGLGLGGGLVGLVKAVSDNTKTEDNRIGESYGVTDEFLKPEQEQNDSYDVQDIAVEACNSLNSTHSPGITNSQESSPSHGKRKWCLGDVAAESNHRNRCRENEGQTEENTQISKTSQSKSHSSDRTFREALPSLISCLEKRIMDAESKKQTEETEQQHIITKCKTESSRIDNTVDRTLQPKGTTLLYGGGRMAPLGVCSFHSSKEIRKPCKLSQEKQSSLYKSCESGSDSGEEFVSAHDSFDNPEQNAVAQPTQKTPRRQMRQSFADRLQIALGKRITDEEQEAAVFEPREVEDWSQQEEDQQEKIRLKREDSTGFCLEEKSYEHDFFTSESLDQKKWIENFRSRRSQSRSISRMETGDSSRYSFSSDYSSELDEMYDQFGHWMEEPDQTELRPRELAVFRFAHGLLKRTLSDSFTSIAMDIENIGNDPKMKDIKLSGSAVEEIQKSKYPRSMSLTEKQCKERLALEVAKKIVGSHAECETEKEINKTSTKKISSNLVSALQDKVEVDPEGIRPIATGNWGCGSQGGDPQLKAMIQWLAASRSDIPCMIYYTCGNASVLKLDIICRLILDRHWTVGELATAVLSYAQKKLHPSKLQASPLFRQGSSGYLVTGTGSIKTGSSIDSAPWGPYRGPTYNNCDRSLFEDLMEPRKSTVMLETEL